MRMKCHGQETSFKQRGKSKTSAVYFVKSTFTCLPMCHHFMNLVNICLIAEINLGNGNIKTIA